MIWNLIKNTETIFYDGGCGFCHRWVKFVIRKDKHHIFDFAPRDSEHFRNSIDPDLLETLPASILVHKRDGKILSRSSATLYILKQLGGLYSPLSSALSLCPRFIRDFFYLGVSKIRHKIYAKPETSGPIVPEDFRDRFKS